MFLCVGDVEETDAWYKPVDSAQPPSPSCLQSDTDQSGIKASQQYQFTEIPTCEHPVCNRHPRKLPSYPQLTINNLYRPMSRGHSCSVKRHQCVCVQQFTNIAALYSLYQGWATLMMARATIFSHLFKGATMHIYSQK